MLYNLTDGTAVMPIFFRIGRELGNSNLGAFQKAWHSQPTAIQSVKRGEKIIKEKGLKLIG
jgi:hypothetical protein